MNILKQKQIRNFTKKNPKWKEIFLEWLDNDEDLNVERLQSIFDTLFKYKDLLKNDITIDYAKALTTIHFDKKPNILSRLFTRSDQDIVEVFSDNIDSLLHTKQKNNFIKSLKTKNYSHLFNNKVEAEINTILDNKITIPAMKSQFFKKLASFKTSKDLLISLKAFKIKNTNWNESYYLSKIQKDKININIISSLDNTLMIEVKDYDACKAMGSQAWCIVKHKSSFDSYTQDLQRQLIYFDFKLPVEDNNSIIGFTVLPNGSVKNSHLKNDDRTPESIINDFKFQEASNEIIHKYLTSISPTLAFKYIMKNDLVDHYDLFDEQNSELVNNTYNIFSDDIVKENNRDNNKFKLEKFSDNNPTFRIGYVSKIGSIKLLEKFLKEGKDDPSHQNNWAIRAASSAGQCDIVRLLIKDSRVDPSDNNNESLKLAIQNKDTETVRVLLNDVRVLNLIKGNDELLLANEYNATEIFKIFLKHEKTDVSKDDNFIFIDSIKKQRFKHIEMLSDDLRVDLSSNDNKISKELLNNNMYKELNFLIDNGLIDPSFNDYYIIKKITLADGLKQNDRDLSVLDIARRNGNADLINILTGSNKMKRSDDSNKHVPLSKLDFIKNLSVNENILHDLNSTWIKTNIDVNFQKYFMENLQKQKNFLHKIGQ